MIDKARQLGITDESAIGIGFGLLDTAEASRATGIPIQTLTTWRSRQMGPPYVRLSAGKVRYQLSDLKRWIDERRVVPTGGEAA